MARSFVSRMPSLVKLAVPLTATALVAAACGSGGGSSAAAATTVAGTTSAVVTSAGTSAAATPAAGGVVITTASGSAGKYLTDGAGRALYLWAGDSTGKSACAGACAQAWPPLTAKAGTPTVAGGVEDDDLGTIVRADGSRQVTYYGHPLYYFVADMGAGQTSGQGSTGFGAKWSLVALGGTAITGSAGAAPSTGSTAGGGWS